MPLTKDQAAQKVIARLIEKGEKADGLLKPDIISWIDEALQRLARRVANSPVYAELQKSIIANMVSGVYTFSDTSLLLDTISKTGSVTISGTGTVFLPVPNYNDLSINFVSTDVGHYFISGTSLLVRDTNGNRVPTLNFLIFANFIPTLGVGGSSDLPVKFENLLIDTLIEMAVEKQERKPSPLIQTGGIE